MEIQVKRECLKKKKKRLFKERKKRKKGKKMKSSDNKEMERERGKWWRTAHCRLPFLGQYSDCIVVI